MQDFGTGTQKTVIAHRFEEHNYDVDRIIGVQNIRLQDPEALGALALIRLGPSFQTHVRPGAFVAGRRNFGYGHPHVQATIALRHVGIVGVIADSFTPGFWRGSMAMGFMLVSCPGISGAVEAGTVLTIDWRAHTVCVGRGHTTLAFRAHTPFEQRLLQAGGIVPLLDSSRSSENASPETRPT